MNLQQVRAVPVPTPRAMLLALAMVGLIVALFAKPEAAEAGVAGQQEAWNIGFGTEPGQLFSPKQLGVDRTDGSVFIVNSTPEFTEKRIEKFSPTGAPLGGVSLPRTPDNAGAEGRKGFIGVAVDDNPASARPSVFYLLQTELGLETGLAEVPVATKILAFSTQPQGSALVPAATPSLTLAAPNTPKAIIRPKEMRVDPSNGDLVISGESAGGKAILQRITPTGAEGARYEEAGTKLRVSDFSESFGFDIGDDGTTYIVANTSTEEAHPSIEGFTLPPKFVPASGPLTLTPLPGFAAAGVAEGWGKSTFALDLDGAGSNGDGWGPQVALASPGGEETLFWKTAAEPTNEGKGSEWLHGYSLSQGATRAVYGGGSSARNCAIETGTASLAATTSGNLVVLDGGELVEEESTLPSFGLNVLRFGPGGSGCPDVAPLAALKTGSTEVTSVAAGTSVTLDASGSELGGNTLTGLVWQIEGPGGTETIPVAGPAPALQTNHVFATQGSYTVGLALSSTAIVGFSGSHFVAQPKHLTVTAGGGGTDPTVTGLNPNHGPAAGGTVVTITGTNLTGATEVKFGAVAATNVTAVSATEVKATSPAGTAGGKVDVVVTAAGGSSATGAADQFTYDSAGGTAPTVTGLNPNHGAATGGTVVTITGTNLTGATEVKFGAVAATNVTAVSATEVKATSPAGTAGGKVDVVVTAAGGSSAIGAADQFTYDQATRTLTVNKVGSGSGTVTCDGAECRSSYPAGSSVQLVATPAAGSTFVGWSGAGCSGTGPCTVVLTSNASVNATFNTSTQSGGGGGGSSNPPANNPPAGNPPATNPPSTKTKAQKLAAQRKKALAKCKKLHGKAKSQCVKHANQIGKPKKHKKS
jgi:hypothetical protein